MKIKFKNISYSLFLVMPIVLLTVFANQKPNNIIEQQTTNNVTFKNEDIELHINDEKLIDEISDNKVQFRIKKNGFDYGDLVMNTTKKTISDNECIWTNNQELSVNISEAKNFTLTSIYLVENDSTNKNDEFNIGLIDSSENAIYMTIKWNVDKDGNAKILYDNYSFIGTQSLDGGDIAGIVVISSMVIGAGLVVWRLITHSKNDKTLVSRNKGVGK